MMLLSNPTLDRGRGPWCANSTKRFVLAAFLAVGALLVTTSTHAQPPVSQSVRVESQEDVLISLDSAVNPVAKVVRGSVRRSSSAADSLITISPVEKRSLRDVAKAAILENVKPVDRRPLSAVASLATAPALRPVESLITLVELPESGNSTRSAQQEAVAPAVPPRVTASLESVEAKSVRSLVTQNSPPPPADPSRAEATTGQSGIAKPQVAKSTKADDRPVKSVVARSSESTAPGNGVVPQPKKAVARAIPDRKPATRIDSLLTLSDHSSPSHREVHQPTSKAEATAALADTAKPVGAARPTTSATPEPKRLAAQSTRAPQTQELQAVKATEQQLTKATPASKQPHSNSQDSREPMVATTNPEPSPKVSSQALVGLKQKSPEQIAAPKASPVSVKASPPKGTSIASQRTTPSDIAKLASRPVQPPAEQKAAPTPVKKAPQMIAKAQPVAERTPPAKSPSAKSVAKSEGSAPSAQTLISLDPAAFGAAKKLATSTKTKVAGNVPRTTTVAPDARRVDLKLPAPENVPVALEGVMGEPLPFAEGAEVWAAPSAPCNTACDTIGPNSPCPVYGFHCVGCAKCCGSHHGGQKKGIPSWGGAGPIPWEAFAQGEYVGPARAPHVPEYRLRVDDIIDFTYRLTREPSHQLYRLDVGDKLNVESLTTPENNREVLVEPDGRITVPLLGQVPAAGLTMADLTAKLDELYSTQVRDPQMMVSPIEINTRLEELRATVDNRGGIGGGQVRRARVTPAGTIQLPAIGSVYAQGLTLREVEREVEASYRKIVDGLGVTPILEERAPRYIYVVGEVKNPGRFDLVGPTTLMQSIALAGSWNVGANLRHVVVFRRDENWKLMATKLDIHDALFGKHPCPADEIWLRDSDIVVVPKRAILAMDDAIELLFTRGLYSVFPVNFGYALRLGPGLSTLP